MIHRIRTFPAAVFVIGLACAADAAHATVCQNAATGANPSVAPSDTGDGDATACGRSAVAGGARATAYGYFASAPGQYSQAFGYSTSAGGYGSTTLGYQASSTQDYGTAIGYSASTTASGAVAIGYAAMASGLFSAAIGNYSKATATRGFALGHYALSDHQDTIILGAAPSEGAGFAYADIGNGTSNPLAPLHLFRDDSTQEMLILDSNELGVTQDRPMIFLSNNGGIRFEFANNALGTSWRFQAATGNQDRFEVTKVGSGQIELALDASGNLDIQGTLSEGSDRASKQDIEALGGDAVLERLAKVPVSEWAYKRSPDTRHVGPMAQDFHAAFGLGKDDRHISARDMAGVNMAAIQELELRNRRLEERNQAVEQRNDALEARVDQLEALVTRLLPRTAQN